MRILYHPKKIVVPINCVEYGLLYNWFAVADERNIAAEGWSIPDNTINQQLADNLGGEAIAGKKLKSVSSWVINTGTNSSGFNAKGAGYRYNTGEFVELMESSYIWTSIEDPITPTEAYSSDLYDSGDYFNVGLYSKTKNTGATIRLKKDTTILNPGETGIYIGNDLRQYSTICIADSDGNNKQEWLADNLMETKFRNRDTIPWYGANPSNYFTNAEWAALTTAGVCAYDNDVNYVGCDFQFPSVEYTNVNYGYLYNWYAAMGDADGSGSSETSIAVSGWHLPAYTECDTLVAYLGGISVAGGALKETGLTHWNSPNNGATNSSGFKAVGEGFRSTIGLYSQIGVTSQILNTYSATSTTTSVFAIGGSTNTNAGTYVSGDKRRSGHAVRLLKDSTTLTHGQTGIYIGNDGKIYPTICIGTQEWLATNLAETLYRNGSSITNVTDDATWAALTTGARCAYNNDETNAINP